MFYFFNQNNSGGDFIVRDPICPCVIIEADTVSDACERAVAIGIYFDGCDTGRDCECCGDRWHRPWSERVATEVPMVRGQTDLQKGANTSWYVPVGELHTSVIYKDGRIERYFKQAK
jgi:hypothetical protein